MEGAWGDSVYRATHTLIPPRPHTPRMVKTKTNKTERESEIEKLKADVTIRRRRELAEKGLLYYCSTCRRFFESPEEKQDHFFLTGHSNLSRITGSGMQYEQTRERPAKRVP